jgi:hypothetical protein
MGAAASTYTRREHDLGQAAELYAAALEESAGGAAVRDAVATELAQAASDVGIGVRDRELDEIAAEVRGLGLSR